MKSFDVTVHRFVKKSPIAEPQEIFIKFVSGITLHNNLGHNPEACLNIRAL